MAPPMRAQKRHKKKPSCNCLSGHDWACTWHSLPPCRHPRLGGGLPPGLMHSPLPRRDRWRSCCRSRLVFITSWWGFLPSCGLCTLDSSLLAALGGRAAAAAAAQADSQEKILTGSDKQVKEALVCHAVQTKGGWPARCQLRAARQAVQPHKGMLVYGSDKWFRQAPWITDAAGVPPRCCSLLPANCIPSRTERTTDI